MRRLKIIQVNIYKGKYLGDLVKFLKKEDADVVTMQEVTKGDLGLDGAGADSFNVIKSALGLNGFFNNDFVIFDMPGSMHGNAVLSKFPIISTGVIRLNKFDAMNLKDFNDQAKFPYFPRSIAQANLDVNGVEVAAMSVHGAWTAPPTDTPEVLRQAEMIANHLRSFGNEPFLLGGDFNMPPQMKVIEKINSVAQNFMRGSGIIQTTNPKVHKIAPRGYLIDYIFASKHFKLGSIKAPEVLVSDHLPVVAEVEFSK